MNNGFQQSEGVFNVRVYGILIHNNSVLVSDELYSGWKITKFPGGGLHFGESTHNCLKREFLEELQLEIEITGHFYTVDIFQESAFDATQQVISIYYSVSAKDAASIPVVQGKFDFASQENGAQVFRWQPLETIHADEFTFPIDKKVSELLKATHQGS